MTPERPYLSAEILDALLESSVSSGRWDGRWVRSNKPGHTQETLEVAHPASGRETAVYMVLARLAGEMEAATGVEVLGRLMDLVVKDSDGGHTGCMRWFAEESRVSDTNAAFFTLMPFLVLHAVQPEALSDAEWERVRILCGKTLPWFEREAAEPHWYYPNKVISDVAVLWGIGRFLEDPELCDRAGRFAEDWIRYTEERGWGWGENLSLGYIPVILVAVQYLIRTAKSESWVCSLEKLEEELLDVARFCDGKECVPSIRSYNFSGGESSAEVLQWVIGNPQVPDQVLAEGRELPWKSLMIYFLYADHPARNRYVRPPVPREKRIRVFDGHDAVSWAGKGIRLGSCSRFPVMPGHYQHETWGLGWQSFPVSVLMEGRGVGRLQWRTEQQGDVNTHPTSGPNGIYRNYRIFGNNDCAEPVTFARQQGPLAVVIRSVKHAVLEGGPAVSDEWWFPPDMGLFCERGGWWLLEQDGVTLAIKPLAVYCGEGDSPRTVKAEAVEEKTGHILRLPVLEETGTLGVYERLETAWVIRAIPASDPQSVAGILATISISDTVPSATELPREDYAYVRKLAVSDGERTLSLDVDYHWDFQSLLKEGDINIKTCPYPLPNEHRIVTRPLRPGG